MLVEIQNIRKSYYTSELETRALQDVSFRIDAGEFVAIEGPSGCGKSSLLSILALLEPPTAGTYLLRGATVSTLSLTERAAIRNRLIGIVFQQFNLLGELSVFDNVELPLVYRGMRSTERYIRVTEVLERVRMSHRAKHFPFQLSGGEQQRVAVARALSGSPALLLADEPTGNLDMSNGEAVMELLSEINRQGSTIVMVTHDSRFGRFANRTLQLLDGRLASGHLGSLHEHDQSSMR